MRSGTGCKGAPSHQYPPVACEPCDLPCLSVLKRCRVLHVHLSRVDTLLGQAVVLVPLGLLRTAGSGGMQLRLPLTHGAGTLTLRVALVTHTDIMCGQPLLRTLVTGRCER